MMMQATTTRRRFLQLAAGLPCLAATAAFASMHDEATITRLIRESRAYPKISQRMDSISKALLGIRYQSNTLIGSPRQQEVFVVRADAFDCVTFCEVVMAAAMARDFESFESTLRTIRYENGRVEWNDRNHYFAEWIRRANEKGLSRPVAMQPSSTIDKVVNWKDQGRRRISIAAIPAATFFANRNLLAAGDVIGFVSRRANLDFYHTGLIAFGKSNELLLRHASQSRRRTLDERMESFFAANQVSHVTLTRAVDSA
jgi:hypothetical protein